MKKTLLVFVILSLFSVSAQAQKATIENAVGFTKPVVKETAAEQKTDDAESKIGKIPQMDAGEMLAKTTKNISIFDNPRYVKRAYGSLKGRQQAMEQLQQKKLEKSSYPNEKAKKEALKDLEDKALVRFNDYDEETEDVKKKLSDNPRESMLNMASRISYPQEVDEETIDRSRKATEKWKQQFIENNGITPDEYMNAYNEQVKLEMEQREEEKNKADKFPILNTEKDVKVEKVDEQNALLHVSVGAPKSKKE